MAEKDRIIYEFGGFRLDATERRLTACADGATVPMTPKVLDTLLCLVEHRGEVLDKAALMHAIWPNVVVEENNLSQNISTLRRLLGEAPDQHRFIVTLPGRGYRFVAAVREVAAEAHDEAILQSVAAARPRLRTLAVLPFKPLVSTDRLESLELGMADTLIMRLGSVRNLAVTPLSSVRRFAGLDQDPLSAGRALGVECVLEGSIQRSGDRLRVSARLVDVADARQLWASRFDDSFTDIFAVQDTIADRVTSALAVQLTPPEQRRLRRAYTHDAEAYQRLVTGSLLWHRMTPDSLKQAMDCYTRAIERDPEFALAHLRLGACYVALGSLRVSAPREVFPHAREAILRALEIDPELWEAHVWLGIHKVLYEFDWPGAESCYERALELSPNDALTHQLAAIFLAARGDLDHAIAEIRCAQVLEPASVVYGTIAATLLHHARRYEQALEQLQATLKQAPGFATARLVLGRTYMRMGDYVRAIAEFESMASLRPSALACLVQAYALAGEGKRATAEMARLHDLSRQEYLPARDVAEIHTCLGAIDSAFEWLNRALEDRSQTLWLLRVDAGFEPLRADPRFARVLERMGLSDRRSMRSQPALTERRWMGPERRVLRHI